MLLFIRKRCWTYQLAVGLALLGLSNCSLLNREGPDVNCADLENGEINACGDGIIASCEGGEIRNHHCDDAKVCEENWQVPGHYACSKAEISYCGDGEKVEGEACDDGNDSDEDACTTSCQLAACGDGFVQAGEEECDDGNDIDEDECTTDCKPAACGDGFIQVGEECDDGNDTNEDACTNGCALPVCGDGVASAGEECAHGASCSVSGECASGFCVEGMCCNSACDGACDACSVAAGAVQDGQCSILSAGAEGAPSCTPYLCDGVSEACSTSCLDETSCATGFYCDGTTSACVALKVLGEACSASKECTSTNCVDDVCCDSACGGPCDACSVSAGAVKDGECNSLAAGSSGDPSCAPYLCDGQDPLCPATCGSDGDCAADSYCAGQSCVPKKSDGTSCTLANECVSGACVDAVCCATACAGACQACSAAKTGSSDGLCMAVSAGTDPESECANGACDGTGACRLDDGESCAGGSDCLSTLCVDSVCCATACSDSCEACSAAKTGGNDGQCAAVSASTDPDSECADGACDGTGSCRSDDGQSCTLGSECLSTLCVDGRCCDTACSGSCEACSAAKTGGADGVCAQVAAATDPDDECALGACDGAGGCKLDNGQSCTMAAECASAVCVDSVCCASACNGACEACDLTGTIGVCNPTAANQDPNDECAAGACDGTGNCRLDDGKACAAGSDCLSTLCVDDVCCGTACGGSCEACSAAKTGGSDGQCAAVSASTDPDNECSDGACDGGGICRLDDGQSCSLGTNCLSTFCVDAVCCASACDATCEACSMVKTGGADGSCAFVTIATDPDAECTLGSCDGGGVCKADNGQACTAAGQCVSGICQDAVCCDGACSGLCEACDVVGSVGSCTFIAGGQDPDDDCTAGACDGAGVCKLDNGQPCMMGGDCGSGVCKDAVCCDGACAGVCEACDLTGTVGSCSPIAATEDPDNECANGACDGAGVCRLDVGEACMAGADCLSTQCVDAFCCATACNGVCEACSMAKTGGSDGQCASVSANTDPDNECPSGACGGTGSCRWDDGESCGVASDCLSSLCVDATCCATACTGTCQACDLPGLLGQCAPNVLGTDPGSDCTSTQLCDGAGACRERGSEQWSQHYDGNTSIIKVASDGTNVIFTAAFSTQIDVGGGALMSAGSNDVLIAKLSDTGAHQFSKRFGDAASQMPAAVAVDSSGNIIVVGNFEGTVDFGGGDLTSAGGDDIFIVKLDPNGNHLWSKRFGDADEQTVEDVSVDSTGNVFLVGEFKGTVNFGGAALTAVSSNRDLFVAKLSSAGSHLWSEQYGTANFLGGALGCAVDSNGRLGLVGYFSGLIAFGSFTFPDIGSSDFDAYLVVFDGDGTAEMAGYFGDTDFQYAVDVVFDSDDDLAVIGYFAGAIDFGAGTHVADGWDSFLVKFSSGSNTEWSTTFSDNCSFPPCGQEPFAYAVAAAGDEIVVAGEFKWGANFGGGTVVASGDDLFVARYSTHGSHLWSKALGSGSGSFRYNETVAVDALGQVLLGVRFQSAIDFGAGVITPTGLDTAVGKLFP